METIKKYHSFFPERVRKLDKLNLYQNVTSDELPKINFTSLRDKYDFGAFSSDISNDVDYKSVYYMNVNIRTRKFLRPIFAVRGHNTHMVRARKIKLDLDVPMEIGENSREIAMSLARKSGALEALLMIRDISPTTIDTVIENTSGPHDYLEAINELEKHGLVKIMFSQLIIITDIGEYVIDKLRSVEFRKQMQ